LESPGGNILDVILFNIIYGVRACAYVCLQVLHQEREEDELIKQIKRKKQAELRKKRRSMTADDMQRENEKLEEVSPSVSCI
jgi:hypothetical protein